MRIRLAMTPLQILTDSRWHMRFKILQSRLAMNFSTDKSHCKSANSKKTNELNKSVSTTFMDSAKALDSAENSPLPPPPPSLLVRHARTEKEPSVILKSSGIFILRGITVLLLIRGHKEDNTLPGYNLTLVIHGLSGGSRILNE